jgi:hypothetical protein
MIISFNGSDDGFAVHVCHSLRETRWHLAEINCLCR